ncbi:MAG: DUF1684 domain-containing protein [Burkholderiales bacterium]|nr:DUF1684 domain-containing protein [Burkholderiales bacterium]
MKHALLFAALTTLAFSFGIAAAPVTPAKTAEPEYVDAINQWRDTVEKNLRRDNGWLTLAGRFIMKPGVNTFGTASNNDIVFPAELKGTGPELIGTITVDAAKKSVTLKLADGVSMTSEGAPFTGERVLKPAATNRDWVSLGRISMHVIERDGRYVLRLADNESLVRKGFPGRVWYDVNPAFKVSAKFVPYPPGKKLSIVNVIDEISEEPCPGYVEFTLKGKKYKMDVIGEDEGLFFVMRDGTAGDTTYRPSRFLYVDKKPKPNETFQLDFNKTYNPPCAFSEFTTCPLPPEQNILKTRIEAGEKYRKLG